MVESPSSLRVLYSFPHPLGSPGIGRTAWHQVDELVRAGHRVRVVTTRLAAEPPPGARVTTTLASVPGRAAGRALGVDRVMGWNDLCSARALARSPGGHDVVHTWPAGGVRTVREAHRHGVAVVRELPNTHTEHAYAVARTAAEEAGVVLPAANSHAFHGRRLARELLEYAEATALLAPSEPVVESVVARGVDPRRVLRHRYGFDPRAFPLDLARRHRPRADGAPVRALFLGRAEPRKGLHLALRAWRASAASREGVLTVAGAFVPGYREALGELLEHPSVRVTGFTDRPADACAEHDVLLLPSAEEGSALVTYEAAAMGCVPLVSEAAGARTWGGRAPVVHPTGDWGALAADLDRLAARPALLAELQQECLDARDRLTWAAGVALTADAYRDAVALEEERRG